MTTLVLAPGLLCDEFVWQHALANITEFPCVVADFSTQNSIVQMAQDALDATPGDLMVAGFSMGGRVAFQMWRLAPERVKGLALLDTDANPKVDAEVAPRELLVKTAYEQGMQSLCDAWLPNMVHPDRHNDPLMASLQAMILRKNLNMFRDQITALLGRPDARGLLPQIKSRTLVLCGRQDNFCPLARHEELAAALPDSELVVVEDAGHFALVERPEVVTSALKSWVTSLNS